jgi:hypothetical protein
MIVTRVTQCVDKVKATLISSCDGSPPRHVRLSHCACDAIAEQEGCYNGQ